MILKVSTQYKKDLKRYQNKPSKIASLKEVLKHLKKSGSVPAAYKPHMLSGKLKGFMECHVEDDFLLWMKSMRRFAPQGKNAGNLKHYPTSPRL